MDGTDSAILVAAVAGVVFASALGVAVWRMVSRERREPSASGHASGHERRVFPLPPRFGLALPGSLAWVLVMVLACALDIIGVRPGVASGIAVSIVLVGPFALFGYLHVRMRREYDSALAAGELSDWRETVLRLERAERPGFWGTLVVTSLVSLFVIVPLATVVVASFGVAVVEVRGGLVALAVVLPVPVATGVWLIPRASNNAERRRELEGASSFEHETK